MASPPPTTDAGWSDWLKLLIPATIVAVVVLLWGIVRPLCGRLIFYFIEHRDMRQYFRHYVGETMPELGVSLRTTESAVRTLQDIVKDVARTQTEQHQVNVGSQQELREDLEKFNDKMDKVTAALGRIEGREEVRQANESNHPQRRRGDHR